MDADRWERIDQLFAEAREEPPDEQAAFLRSHCDDRAVRAEVASLLDAREEAPAFFEAAAEQVVAPALAEFEGTGVPDGSERTALDLAGQRVAAYRVEAQTDGDWTTIHQGTTIGHKWLARLSEPVTRPPCWSCRRRPSTRPHTSSSACSPSPSSVPRPGHSVGGPTISGRS